MRKDDRACRDTAMLRLGLRWLCHGDSGQMRGQAQNNEETRGKK
jgi:hypothetical protein